MQVLERLEGLRRRAGGTLVDGFFKGAARVGRLHPLARPDRHGVEIVRDVAYAEDGAHARHRLDVYRPRERSGPLPTVLYIHGGGFRILSKDTHWIMGLSFARRGYLVLVVGYRLAPAHPFPAAVEDVMMAFDWLTRHGREWGADLDNLVVAGESAGANLATTLALASVYRRPEPYAARVFDSGVVPKAVLPACGIFQVSDVDRFARRKPRFPRFLRDRLEEVERGYLGSDPLAHGASLDLADPLSWLERAEPPDRPLPPFFLPVGTRDPLLDDTRRLAAALRAHGAEAEDRYYPGELHAFHAFPFLASSRKCWDHTFSFLSRTCPAG